MSLKQAKQVVTALVITIASIAEAQANIVDYGNYTRDTVTQLEWYDVSLTKGMSKEEVITSINTVGSTLSGLRYASVSDFNTLINHYFVGQPRTDLNLVNHDSVQAFDLIEMLGVTSLFSAPFSFTSVIKTKGILDIPSLIDSSYVAEIYLLSDGLNPSNNEAHTEISLIQLNNQGSSFTGSYLVRDINSLPIPAAVWLFASGVLGLIGFSTNTKKVEARNLSATPVMS